MNKKYLLHFFSFVIMFVILLCNKVSAITSTGDYTIESYDIEMIVNENNTFDITEKITAYFSSPKHRNI